MILAFLYSTQLSLLVFTHIKGGLSYSKSNLPDFLLNTQTIVFAHGKFLFPLYILYCDSLFSTSPRSSSSYFRGCLWLHTTFVIGVNKLPELFSTVSIAQNVCKPFLRQCEKFLNTLHVSHDRSGKINLKKVKFIFHRAKKRVPG